MIYKTEDKPSTHLAQWLTAWMASPITGSVHTRCILLLVLLIVVACSGGCSSQAKVSMISLNTERVSSTEALVITCEPKECYYWVDENENLCVALSGRKRSLFGTLFEEEFRMSLLLDGLPSGSAKSYLMDMRTARVRYRRGLAQTRSASLHGVAAVWDYGSDELHGRFRFYAKQQSFLILSGWSGNLPVVFVGEFRATNNEARGNPILERTERDGMARPSAPQPSPRRILRPKRPRPPGISRKLSKQDNKDE